MLLFNGIDFLFYESTICNPNLNLVRYNFNKPFFSLDPSAKMEHLRR